PGGGNGPVARRVVQRRHAVARRPDVVDDAVDVVEPRGGGARGATEADARAGDREGAGEPEGGDGGRGPRRGGGAGRRGGCGADAAREGDGVRDDQPRDPVQRGDVRDDGAEELRAQVLGAVWQRAAGYHAAAV